MPLHPRMYLAAGIAVLLALAGCAREQPSEEDRPHDIPRFEQPDPAGPQPALSDQDLLMLIDRLPLGAKYDDVARLFPQATLPEPATHAPPDQARSEAEVAVLNQVTTLEFNFADGELYSYFFHASPLGCPEARSLYERLTRFYSDLFGGGSEEEEAEPGYTHRTTMWQRDTFEVAVTHGRQADECRVGWGFQEPVHPRLERAPDGE